VGRRDRMTCDARLMLDILDRAGSRPRDDNHSTGGDV
jgi:hypothetical protein